jgi:hypothetical protein
MESWPKRFSTRTVSRKGLLAAESTAQKDWNGGLLCHADSVSRIISRS